MNLIKAVKTEIRFILIIKKAIKNVLKDFDKDLNKEIVTVDKKPKINDKIPSTAYMTDIKSQIINNFFTNMGKGSFIDGLNVVCAKYDVPYSLQDSFLGILTDKIQTPKNFIVSPDPEFNKMFDSI